MSGMDVDQIFVSGGKTQSTDEKINLSLDELVQQNRSNSKRKSNQKIRTTIREQGARRQQKFDNQRGLKANKPAGKAIIRNRANQILKNAIKRKQRGTSNGDVTPRRNRQNNNNNNDGNNNNNNKNNKNISPKKIFTKMGNRLNLQAKNRPSRPRTRAGEGWFEDRQGSNKNNGGVKINKPTDIKITVNNDRSNNKSNTVASRRSRGNDNNRNGNNRNDNNSNNNNGNNNNNRNSRNGLTRQGLRISGGVQKRQGFVSDRLRNNKKNIRVRDNNNDNRNNNNNNNNNSNNNNSNANKSSGNSARRRVVREPGTTSNSNSSSSTPSSTAPKTLSDRFAELRRKKNNNNNNSNNNAGNSKRRIIRRQ